MEKMRAARYLEKGRIVCEQAPVPAPGDGEVLVRSQLAAICGSDLHVVYDGMSFPRSSAMCCLPTRDRWSIC